MGHKQQKQLLAASWALVVLCRMALSQQTPITMTIEYQHTDALTADQQVLLKAAVNAAYRSLQTSVMALAPTSQLLSDRVCRSYAPLPPPPPSPPSPPPAPDNPGLPPDAPDAPAASGRRRQRQRRRRALLSAATEEGLGEAEERQQRQQQRQQRQQQDGPGAAGADGAAAGVAAAAAAEAEAEGGVAASRRSLQAAVRRCYPDFAADDARLRTCGRADISSGHVRDPAGGPSSVAGGPGEVTDLYLYLTSDATDPACYGTGLRTFTCLYDPATGRPTMASINICPSALDAYDPNSLVTRVLREMFVALGVQRVGFFGLPTPALYASYIASQLDAASGRTLQYLATSNVQQVVRDHFGCDTAPGAMLEDALYGAASLADGSVVAGPGEQLADADYVARSAVVFAGWETTHFQGDILVADPNTMSAAATAPQVTRLTLALILDTTWYGVSTAGQGYWSWGEGGGCRLAAGHCTGLVDQPVEAGRPLLFCNAAAYAGQTLCAPGGGSVGTCRSGGAFTGGCGLVTSPTPGLPTCSLPELALLTLSSGSPTASATYGWASGPDSRCVQLTWPWAARAGASALLPAVSYSGGGAGRSTAGASCFRTSCTEDGRLFVGLLGGSVRCPTGGSVNLTAALPGSGLQIAMLGPCPDNALLCATTGCLPANCSPTGGECRSVSGGPPRCFCRAGYGGAGCSVDLMSGAVEDLAAAASAFAVLEASVVLRTPLSRFYARRAQFVKVVSDSASPVFPSSIQQQLSVARIQSMASFPDYPGSRAHIQVVVRYLAASQLQAALFEQAFGGGLVTADLDRFGFTTVANSSVYLGQTVLRTMPPPSPPAPPRPPSPPPTPPASPPMAPLTMARPSGLSGDEKVAVGVGVTFGVLLLVVVAAWLGVAYRRWREDQAGKDGGKDGGKPNKTHPAGGEPVGAVAMVMQPAGESSVGPVVHEGQRGPPAQPSPAQEGPPAQTEITEEPGGVRA